MPRFVEKSKGRLVAKLRKLRKTYRSAIKHSPTMWRVERAWRQGETRLLGAKLPPVAEDIIVSLTTFPLRLGKLHHVVSSLLDQSLRPRKVVLYLSLCEFPERSVPKSLARLEGDQFEIRFVAENLRSHNKLQFALVDFPGKWIATADDDRLYPVNWLSSLFAGALESPRTIVSTVGRRMVVGDGRLLPYRQWPHDYSPRPSFLLFPVGSWGVLYPPDTLNSAIGDRDLIRRLAPRDDDTWFKVMSLLQNVPCRALGTMGFMPDLRFKHNVRLWDVNQYGVLMDEALNLVFDHFGLTADTLLAKEAALQKTNQCREHPP
jgi:hypothetical protein